MTRPQQQIDLTQMCEHQLIELNRKIVERLRFLRDSRAHRQMLELAPGQKVSFSPEPGRKVVGTIIRLNRKSVSLVSTDGVQWRVVPALVTPVELKDIEVEVEQIDPNPKSEPVTKQERETSPPIPLRRLPFAPSFTAPADVPRNAPCPCGSGKKHKRCCLLKTAAGNR